MDPGLQQRSGRWVHDGAVADACESQIFAPVRAVDVGAGCSRTSGIRSAFERRYLRGRADVFRSGCLWRAGICADAVPGPRDSGRDRALGALPEIAAVVGIAALSLDLHPEFLREIHE